MLARQRMMIEVLIVNKERLTMLGRLREGKYAWEGRKET
jgi:hypothetical protein